MSDNAISVKDITKIYKLYDNPMDRLKEALGLSRQCRYKEHFALSGVSFDVKKGETVGIIGTNGSGKSTILKIITGVLTPTAGQLDIDGRISALLELGAGFNMEYTGIENVYLNGTMIGFSKEEIDAKLQDILDFADIGDFVNQPVKTYSSGMFVRLAFAVAINIDPEILIVDEALSVGDVFFQAKCYKKFEEFKRLGKTILFVSHDLSSISKYCDRVVLLNRGQKVAEGSSKDMVDLYKKIMVGVDVEEALETLEEGEAPVAPAPKPEVLEGDWKSHFTCNPSVDSYGNGRAEIIDYAIIDDMGDFSSAIIKGKDFTVKMKVAFASEVPDPIFAFTIKNIKGEDITGTNTMYEKVNPGSAQPGDVYEIAFTQRMQLQGGAYLLSLGCTGFEGGEFTAYHRLYDVFNLDCISDKNTVGYYDSESKVQLRKL